MDLFDILNKKENTKDDLIFILKNNFYLLNYIDKNVIHKYIKDNDFFDILSSKNNSLNILIDYFPTIDDDLMLLLLDNLRKKNIVINDGDANRTVYYEGKLNLEFFKQEKINTYLDTFDNYDESKKIELYLKNNLFYFFMDKKTKLKILNEYLDSNKYDNYFINDFIRKNNFDYGKKLFLKLLKSNDIKLINLLSSHMISKYANKDNILEIINVLDNHFMTTDKDVKNYIYILSLSIQHGDYYFNNDEINVISKFYLEKYIYSMDMGEFITFLERMKENNTLIPTRDDILIKVIENIDYNFVFNNFYNNVGNKEYFIKSITKINLIDYKMDRNSFLFKLFLEENKLIFNIENIKYCKDFLSLLHKDEYIKVFEYWEDKLNYNNVHKYVFSVDFFKSLEKHDLNFKDLKIKNRSYINTFCLVESKEQFDLLLKNVLIKNNLVFDYLLFIMRYSESSFNSEIPKIYVINQLLDNLDCNNQNIEKILENFKTFNTHVLSFVFEQYKSSDLLIPDIFINYLSDILLTIRDEKKDVIEKFIIETNYKNLLNLNNNKNSNKEYKKI